MVVAVEKPLEQAMSSHFNNGFHGDYRWRYRSDSTAVYWWNYSDVTDEMKRSVEHWLAERGIFARRHIGNLETISVGQEKLLAVKFSHGGGLRFRYRRRVKLLPEENG